MSALPMVRFTVRGPFTLMLSMFSKTRRQFGSGPLSWRKIMELRNRMTICLKGQSKHAQEKKNCGLWELKGKSQFYAYFAFTERYFNMLFSHAISISVLLL